MLGRASLQDLTHLADILETLPDSDIKAVALYAESLAQWPAEPEGSTDGAQDEAQDFGG